ncbi:lymphatic vessel endothelial hyaluronic acid receptor 1a [Alosa alosa]|uniref:lymphatic vessel endothelial hyaluronic acid receptor 1a n=1 Tax=Alosa alosa TaxID=278164 RepID=UPI00201538EF|nr:lymphatic vessel endothelial hyaluronic acid receptor 1a [Alosa alosa]
MTRVWLLLLLLPPACSMLVHHLRRFPDAASVWGVFEVSQVHGGQPQYSFNASVARDVCLQMGVAMATKDQVDQALHHGLQTCRFGWVDEQVAVIPRLQASTLCGQNRTGLVLWRASVNLLFDVFCFNQTDHELQLHGTTTTVRPLITSASPPSSSTSPSSSSSTSPAVNQVEEALNSRQTAAGEVPTVLVISVMFVLLLLGVTTLWYIRRKGSVCPLLGGRVHCKPSDTELKEACVVHLTSHTPDTSPASSPTPDTTQTPSIITPTATQTPPIITPDTTQTPSIITPDTTQTPDTQPNTGDLAQHWRFNPTQS